VDDPLCVPDPGVHPTIVPRRAQGGLGVVVVVVVEGRGGGGGDPEPLEVLPPGVLFAGFEAAPRLPI